METKLTFTHVIPTAIIEAFGITDDTPVYACIHNGTIIVEPVLDEDDDCLLTEDDCPYLDEDGCDDCEYYNPKRKNKRASRLK